MSGRNHLLEIKDFTGKVAAICSIEEHTSWRVQRLSFLDLLFVMVKDLYTKFRVLPHRRKLGPSCATSQGVPMTTQSNSIGTPLGKLGWRIAFQHSRDWFNLRTSLFGDAILIKPFSRGLSQCTSRAQFIFATERSATSQVSTRCLAITWNRQNARKPNSPSLFVQAYLQQMYR